MRSTNRFLGRESILVWWQKSTYQTHGVIKQQYSSICTAVATPVWKKQHSWCLGEVWCNVLTPNVNKATCQVLLPQTASTSKYQGNTRKKKKIFFCTMVFPTALLKTKWILEKANHGNSTRCFFFFLLINVHPCCSLATKAAVCVKWIEPAAGALSSKQQPSLECNLTGDFIILHESCLQMLEIAAASSAVSAFHLPPLLPSHELYCTERSHVSSLGKRKLLCWKGLVQDFTLFQGKMLQACPWSLFLTANLVNWRIIWPYPGTFLALFCSSALFHVSFPDGIHTGYFLIAYWYKTSFHLPCSPNTHYNQNKLFIIQ